MDDFRALADAVATDIETRRLHPGDRLPTQRRFARDHGVAVSTASRVYGELVRRGLAVGEVGRGTFVRAGRHNAAAARTEPPSTRIDLELNFPVLPEQAAMLARSLEGMLRADALGPALRGPRPAGSPAARAAACVALARPGWTPDESQVLFSGNGRQGIAAAIAALVPVGGRLGVEALTYPVVQGVAARLGVELVPIPMDVDGMRPDALAAAGPLRAVYLQPTLHNPLGVTMPAARRDELVRVVTDLDLPVIEDTIYAFLRADAPAPLAAAAPDRTIVVDSLSKRVAPGLTVGYVVPPVALVDRVAAALRSGGWTAPAFSVEVAARWASDGTLRRVETAKHADAAVRQEVLRERLAGFAVHADPAAYHCWWELPVPWRAETFVAAAARRGISITPAAAFTVGTGHAPNAVRVAISVPPVPVLAAALDTLASIARNPGADDGLE